MAFMSGKALFSYNPELFADEDDAADDVDFEEEKEEPVGGAAAGDNDEEVKVDEDLFNDDGADEDVDFD